jgi:hypothetical protein
MRKDTDSRGKISVRNHLTFFFDDEFKDQEEYFNKEEMSNVYEISIEHYKQLLYLDDVFRIHSDPNNLSTLSNILRVSKKVKE